MGFSSKVKDAYQAKQTDNGLRINPEPLLINDGLRTRYYGLDKDHVRELAEGMAQDGHQIAVQVRKVKLEDGTYDLELVSGAHRHAAATLINKDKQLRAIAEENGHIHKDTGVFMLLTKTESMSDEEAFVAGIEENRSHKGTSAVDDAYNQKQLMKVHGWSAERVAERYGIKAEWVKRLQILLELDEETQRKVHNGDLAAYKAIRMKDLSPEKRAEIISASTDGDTGKINTAALEENTRTAKQEASAAEPESRPRTLSRSVATIRKDLRNVIEDENSSDAEVKLAKDVLRYVEGKVGIKGGIFNAAERYAEALETA